MRRHSEETASNGQDNGLGSGIEFDSQKLYPDLDQNVDVRLPYPNMETIKKQRNARAREAMELFNPTLAHKLLPKDTNLSPEDKAAIVIQRVFRGYLGRKEFVRRLYEKYEKEEAEMEQRRREQVMEGEILIENYHLEQELNDKATLRRNRARSATTNALTIQRAWKAYQRRKTGTTIPSEPIDIGQAENGYNEAEFPAHEQTSQHHMHEHQHAHSYGVNRNDLFNDSLENEDDDYDDSGRSDSPDVARSFPGDYLIDDEFDGTFESMDMKFSRFRINQNYCSEFSTDSVHISLPEPTTDWDTIESVLTNESGINSPEEQDNEQIDDYARKFSVRPNLQLCFVDDAGESDAESDPEVKVYIVDEDKTMEYSENPYHTLTRTESQTEREIDSRDSGCVPGDLIDMNIDYVTDYTPNQLQREPLPAEESKRVLISLQMHEEHEEQCKEQAEQKKRESVVPNSATMKSVEELLLLKEELETKVQVISNELVEYLMDRDNLHAEQESLLMEVEDLTKLAQRSEQLPASKKSTKVKVGK